jgi:hypothetical protein
MRHYAPAAIEKALPFITQLAGAIDFARAAGVGHGGLHPRDIFVTPDEARATGFGVVEALEQVGIRAPIRRPYTAPERIEGGAWGTPADVFSLAAITYELLTARRPAGTGAQAGPLPQGDRNEALHAVLARAMDDDPARRYVSALAFAGALESAARGEPESSAVADVAAIALPAPGPAAIPVVQGFSPGPAPGAFEIEESLDPVPAALVDVAIEPTLFDDDVAPEEVVDEIRENHVEPARFAEDFVEDDAPADAEGAAIDDHVAHESVYAAEEPMFAAAGPEPEYHDVDERARPAILPYAVTGVLCLLVGFAAGYFEGSRDRLVPAVESAPVAAAPPPVAPAGPATKEKPGQYSEQKVTAPPPTVAQAAAGAAAAAPVPAPPPAPAARETLAKTGHLVVKSTPSRAGVTVNGKWRGRTPLTLDALPFGQYVVRVVQNGFRVAREDVTLSARDASHTINAHLERTGRPSTLREPQGRPEPSRGATGLKAGAAPATPPSRGASPGGFTGLLYVDSRPRGANVLLDGKNVGQTPLNLSEVPIGSHVVRIEMAGKKTWTSTARVAAGKKTPVTGSLDDKP